MAAREPGAEVRLGNPGLLLLTKCFAVYAQLQLCGGEGTAA